MSKSPSAYRAAGVDIDAKYSAVERSKDAIRSTYTRGVVGDIGLFGGLFDLKAVGADGQLLVASTDGVGTKVKVASATGRLAGVGEDLVNHCVNDILVQGARPLFFLDYIAVATMVPAQVQELITGLAKACRESDCALIGGETAEMPGVYREGELDVAGTIVGCVERERLLDGRRIRVGDRAIALVSSGLHTNGYSLARRVVSEAGVGWDERPADLKGLSVAEALLAVHRSYLKPIWPLLEADLIHGMAHITGGGLVDNVPRILPEGMGLKVTVAAMPRPPIFDYLVSLGKVAQEEAYRVFNMGFGMVIFVAPSDVAKVQQMLAAHGETGHEVGEITAGNRNVRLVLE